MSQPTPSPDGRADDGREAPPAVADTPATGRSVRITTSSSAMPAWLPRFLLLLAAGIVAFQAGEWAFRKLAGLLTLLLVAIFLAAAMEPAVNALAARGWRRGLATALVFLVVLAIGGGLTAALGALLISQAQDLVAAGPSYAQGAVNWINDTFNANLSSSGLSRALSERSASITGYLGGVAGGAIGLGTSLLTLLFQSFTVALFTFYLAADGPRLRRTVCSVLPPDRQATVLRTWEVTVEKTGGYLYSRALLAVFSGIAHYVLFRVIGLPFALTLALWVGVVSQFIPTVGTYLAGALPVIVALTAQPIDALWVLIFVLCYQQFENYILQPKITAKTLDMHPAVAFASVLIGAALLGPVGALLGLPVIATIQAFLSAWLPRYRVHDHPAVEPAPAEPEPEQAAIEGDPGGWRRWLPSRSR